jgi:hypothetical protein
MIHFKIEDEILVVTYKEGITIDLENAVKIIEERKRIQNGKATPLLIYISNVTATSKMVRSFMANEGYEDVLCVAFVVKNESDNIYFNYFLSVDVPPVVPTRIFLDEHEAKAWLKLTVKDLLS